MNEKIEVPIERKGARKPSSASKKQVVNGYSVLSILGKGSFGTVYKGEKDGQLFALQMISKAQVQKKRMQKYVDNQIKIMRQLSSPYIVKLIQCFETKSYLWLVLEYCNEGTLLNYMLSKKPNQEQCMKIFTDILRGFRCIHEQQYLHRDLKPDNIFFKGGVAKIADFGLAKPADMKTTYCGTSFYMAPEIFERQPQTYKVDLWSMGVILFFLIFREYPFKSNINILLDIINNTRPKFSAEKVLRNQDMIKNVSPEILVLFEKIFVYDAEKRISFSQLINMEFFNQYFNQKERLSLMDVYCNLHTPRNRDPSNEKPRIESFENLNDREQQIEVIEKTMEVTEEKLDKFRKQASNIIDNLGDDYYSKPGSSNNINNSNNNGGSSNNIPSPYKIQTENSAQIQNMIMFTNKEEEGSNNIVRGPQMVLISSFNLHLINDDIPIDEQNTLTPIHSKMGKGESQIPSVQVIAVAGSEKPKGSHKKKKVDPDKDSDYTLKRPAEKKKRRSLILLNEAIEKQQQNNNSNGAIHIDFKETMNLYNYEVGRYCFLETVLEETTNIDLSPSNRAIIGYFITQVLLFFAIKLEDTILKKINIFKVSNFEEFLKSSEGIILKGKLEHDIRFWAIRFQLFYFSIDFNKEGKNEMLTHAITENIIEKNFENDLKVPYRTVIDLLFRTIFDLGINTSNPVKSKQLLKISLFILLGLLINSAFEKRNLQKLFPKFFQIEDIPENQFTFNQLTNYINSLQSDELKEQIETITLVAFGQKEYDKYNRNNSIFVKHETRSKLIE